MVLWLDFIYSILAGKTLFITGASRGIGKAIALKAARDGANIVIAAKTADPHPKLPGTIYSAAKEGIVYNSNKRNLKPCNKSAADNFENILAKEWNKYFYNRRIIIG